MPIEVNAPRLIRCGSAFSSPSACRTKTGKDPYAVLQLRHDNANGTLA